MRAIALAILAHVFGSFERDPMVYEVVRRFCGCMSTVLAFASFVCIIGGW